MAKLRQRQPAPAGPEAEIARLREILWQVIVATGTDTGKLKHAPEPGKHDPDVPEWALEAATALRAELVEYTGLTGKDINDECGPDEVCSCGEVVTWFASAWHHLFNASLRPGGSGYNHRAVPATGYYSPDEQRAAEERRSRNPDRNVADEVQLLAERLSRADIHRSLRRGQRYSSVAVDEGTDIWMQPREGGQYRIPAEYVEGGYVTSTTTGATFTPEFTVTNLPGGRGYVTPAPNREEPVVLEMNEEDLPDADQPF